MACQRSLTVVTAFDYRKASSNDHHDRQYLDAITTFAYFDSFAISSEAIFVIRCTRQFKQTKSMMRA